ncbi:unnamed protein product, partial [Ceratitis capitata]
FTCSAPPLSAATADCVRPLLTMNGQCLQHLPFIIGQSSGYHLQVFLNSYKRSVLHCLPLASVVGSSHKSRPIIGIFR